MAIAPSDSRGTNSEPRFGAIMPNATTSTHAAKPIDRRLVVHREPQDRGVDRDGRSASAAARALRSAAAASRLASTGISVSDRTIEPASAKMTVSAIGRNSLPSIPSSVRIGR